ncbi:MAG: hypothetical protein KDC38_19930, partial [Planctomycetes bacterium]|nr:hypothetical protein [Planctomycetota bacterium]
RGATWGHTPLIVEVDALRSALEVDPKLRLEVSSRLGRADLEAAALRANPPVDESRALAERLRGRRRELVAARPALVDEASASLTAGLPRRTILALQHLREHDAEIGEIERAMDRLYALATETSPHRAEQRTRQTAQAIARRRLELLHAELIERGLPADRIRVITPRFEEPTNDAGTITLRTVR